MMAAGRPPLPVGTAGKITTVRLSTGLHRSRARFRGLDGKLREATKTAKTAAGAERCLKEALIARIPEGESGEISPTTTMSGLAAIWLEEVHASTRNAESTKLRYQSIVDSFIVPLMGSLRLREVGVPVIDRVLREVSVKNGAPTAKGVKSCLSGMLGLAVRHGAKASNPVRDTHRISVESPPARALTLAEAETLVQGLRGHRRARELDLVELCEFMLGTGMRLGEACSVRPDRVDLEAGTIEISRTLGPSGVQERTKTKAGWRIIAIPPQLVDMLRRRMANPEIETDVALFPSPLGKLRNVSNTTGMLRAILNELGFDWVSSHTFRKTVATRLDEAGLSARQVADHLGHKKPSMTLDIYMGRNVACAKAADALTGI